MAYDAGTVVVVHFPFTDRNSQKRRPALVLSNADFQSGHGHLILAMITSAKHSSWPSDVQVTDLHEAGLPAPSVVRLKLFTLDERLVLKKIGSLSKPDHSSVWQCLSKIIS